MYVGQVIIGAFSDVITHTHGFLLILEGIIAGFLHLYI